MRDEPVGDDRGPLERLVEVVPGPLKTLIAALSALAIVLGLGSLFIGGRSRRLRRQRAALLEDFGLLQRALLPVVPERLGDLVASVGYRPAEGPGAGGDFYDAFELPEGRVAIVVGDVSGHGREALSSTTLMRHTVRAYLEAGLSPRGALRLAGEALDGDLDDGFATVVAAIYDPADAALSYASAGHPAPIVLGPAEHEPVTACSSPPIGIGVPTGRRQTTVSLPAGSVACLYTDGLTEARVGGELMGRQRLAELVREAGRGASADALLDRVAGQAERTPDDMAAGIVRPIRGAAHPPTRREELELDRSELELGSARSFLEACGLGEADAVRAEELARATARELGSAVLSVEIADGRCQAEVVGPNADRLAASGVAA